MSDTNNGRRGRTLDSAIHILHTTIEWVCVALLIAMIVVTVYQVFMRSVVNNATSWSEEVALLLMIWFGYLGMALGVRERVHISIEFVFDRLPRRAQMVVEAIGRILVGVFSFAMVREGVHLTSISTVQRLPATRLPRSSLYIVLVPAGFLMLLYIVETAMKTIRDMRSDREGGTRG